ncbi:UT2 protein, partial [Atractosteus spatula]|nr:UT2 protein [Atractosteus spatula]
LRGVSQVILANNPLSGCLIQTALVLHRPWQALMDTEVLLSSMFTALIIGKDSKEVSEGLHGFNGMLVVMLICVFSARKDWYLWLLLLCCLAGAMCSFLSSGLAPVLDRWDLPVSVFPFLLQGVPVGVGQIYACDGLWPSVIILVAVFLFSPLVCAHALMGSSVGILAGKVEYSAQSIISCHLEQWFSKCGPQACARWSVG